MSWIEWKIKMLQLNYLETIKWTLDFSDNEVVTLMAEDVIDEMFISLSYNISSDAWDVDLKNMYNLGDTGVTKLMGIVGAMQFLAKTFDSQYWSDLSQPFIPVSFTINSNLKVYHVLAGSGIYVDLPLNIPSLGEVLFGIVKEL